MTARILFPEEHKSARDPGEMSPLTPSLPPTDQLFLPFYLVSRVIFAGGEVTGWGECIACSEAGAKDYARTFIQNFVTSHGGLASPDEVSEDGELLVFGRTKSADGSVSLKKTVGKNQWIAVVKTNNEKSSSVLVRYKQREVNVQGETREKLEEWWRENALRNEEIGVIGIPPPQEDNSALEWPETSPENGRTEMHQSEFKGTESSQESQESQESQTTDMSGMEAIEPSFFRQHSLNSSRTSGMTRVSDGSDRTIRQVDIDRGEGDDDLIWAGDTQRMDDSEDSEYVPGSGQRTAKRRVSKSKAKVSKRSRRKKGYAAPRTSYALDELSRHIKGKTPQNSQEELGNLPILPRLPRRNLNLLRIPSEEPSNSSQADFEIPPKRERKNTAFSHAKISGPPPIPVYESSQFDGTYSPPHLAPVGTLPRALQELTTRPSNDQIIMHSPPKRKWSHTPLKEAFPTPTYSEKNCQINAYLDDMLKLNSSGSPTHGRQNDAEYRATVGGKEEQLSEDEGRALHELAFKRKDRRNDKVTSGVRSKRVPWAVREKLKLSAKDTYTATSKSEQVFDPPAQFSQAPTEPSSPIPNTGPGEDAADVDATVSSESTKEEWVTTSRADLMREMELEEIARQLARKRKKLAARPTAGLRGGYTGEY